MSHEISPQDISSALGSFPDASGRNILRGIELERDPSEYLKKEVRDLMDTSYEILLSRKIPKDLRYAEPYFISEEISRRKSQAAVGIIHIRDRVSAGIEDSDLSEGILDVSVHKFAKLTMEFLNASYDFHTSTSSRRPEEGKSFVSLRDAKNVILADSLTGRSYTAREIASQEQIPAGRKLDMLDRSRGNFTQAMISWMPAR